MRLLALLFAGCSAAKAPESAATSAPVKTATSTLLPPPAIPPLASFISPFMGQSFAEQHATGGFALAAAALAQQGISVADLAAAAQIAAGMQAYVPKAPSTTDFAKLIMQSVPAACAQSACIQVEGIPWNHITRSQCLLYLTTTERCLYAEPACKTAVDLAGPRACCEALAGGSGESPACPRMTLNTTATTPKASLVATSATGETPKGKVGGKLGKAGKAKGSLAPTPGNGKAGKGGKAGQSAGRPTISAPCTCVDTVPLPDDNEMFDKPRCVSHVSALRKCMLKQSCPSIDMAMLSACCDLLPGGPGFNPACTDPASVLTTFLQTSGGFQLPSGLDLDALMQLVVGPAGQTQFTPQVPSPAGRY